MLRHDIRAQHRSTPGAKRRPTGSAAGLNDKAGALKHFYRLIRDCLPLLLALAGYPSRAERQHQQREQQHRESDPKG